MALPEPNDKTHPAHGLLDTEVLRRMEVYDQQQARIAELEAKLAAADRLAEAVQGLPHAKDCRLNIGDAEFCDCHVSSLAAYTRTPQDAEGQDDE